MTVFPATPAQIAQFGSSASSTGIAAPSLFNLVTNQPMEGYGINGHNIGGGQIYKRCQVTVDVDKLEGYDKSWLTVWASNTGSGTRQIYLVNSSDTRLATINVTATTPLKRFKSNEFTLSGTGNYRIEHDEHAVSLQLKSRELILHHRQIEATKTISWIRLGRTRVGNYISSAGLSGAIWSTSGTSFVGPGTSNYALKFKFDPTKFSTLVAVHLNATMQVKGTNGIKGHIILYNLTNGATVASSEIVITAAGGDTTSCIDATWLVDDNWGDANDEFEVRIKRSTQTGDAYLLNCNLGFELDPISTVEIWHNLGVQSRNDSTANNVAGACHLFEKNSYSPISAASLYGRMKVTGGSTTTVWLNDNGTADTIDLSETHVGAAGITFSGDDQDEGEQAILASALVDDRRYCLDFVRSGGTINGTDMWLRVVLSK